MKILATLLAATLLGGCATLDEIMHEEHNRSVTPNPDTSTQFWGHASGSNWSITL